MADWGRRRGEKKRFFFLVRAAPMSHPIPLAEMSCLIIPTELWEKNRLPAVCVLIYWVLDNAIFMFKRKWILMTVFVFCALFCVLSFFFLQQSNPKSGILWTTQQRMDKRKHLCNAKKTSREMNIEIKHIA